MDIARWFMVIALLAPALVSPALPVHAQSDNERYSIMRPEPGSTAKSKSPRRTRQRVTVPQYEPAQPATGVPPPIIAPRTGVALPNLPTISGSGPGGRETSQDRAVRCSHQAGVYGQAAGDRNAYIGTCINQ